jgi:hypothetical protein
MLPLYGVAATHAVTGVRIIHFYFAVTALTVSTVEASRSAGALSVAVKMGMMIKMIKFIVTD